MFSATFLFGIGGALVLPEADASASVAANASAGSSGLSWLSAAACASTSGEGAALASRIAASSTSYEGQ